LGDVHAARGQHERAAEFYTKYGALDDRAPRVSYKLGLAQYRSGQLRPALESLKKAVALDRQLAEAYYVMGLCERDDGRPYRRAAVARRSRRRWWSPGDGDGHASAANCGGPWRRFPGVPPVARTPATGDRRRSRRGTLAGSRDRYPAGGSRSVSVPFCSSRST